MPRAPELVINIPAMRIFYYPPVKKGRAAGRVHTPHRHRQGRLAHARRGHQDRAPPEGPDMARAGVGAQGTPREWRGARAGDRPRAGQSARQVRLLPAVAELPGPRHQQARRAWDCARATAASACTRRISSSSSTWCRWVRRCGSSTSRSSSAGARGSCTCSPTMSLEDDTRDWNKAQKKLLTQSFAARLQLQLQQQHEQVDWTLVSSLSRRPARHSGAHHAHRCEPRADPRRRTACAERRARRLHLGRQVRPADG